MIHILQLLFFALLVRPLVLLFLGLNIRHGEKLPSEGPAVLVANHNSHLDTLVLMSLFPLKMLPKLRPVAAADYFLRNKAIAWFALNIMGIIPLARKPSSKDGPPFQKCHDALERGEILILFPEGSRGQPEVIKEFKTGITHLLKGAAKVPVTPIFLHGLGKALPKDAYFIVPFFCDIFVGDPLYWGKDRQGFMNDLNRSMEELAAEGHFLPWV